MSADRFLPRALAIAATLGVAAIAGTGARAEDAVAACSLVHDTGAGFITIAEAEDSSGPGRLYNLTYEPDQPSVDESGNASLFTIYTLLRGDAELDELGRIVDSAYVTLRFGDASAVTSPAYISYTRDNSVALEGGAPGRLWYPEDALSYDTLELVVYLGDLERQMDWGPDREPAFVLSWVASSVGTDRDSVQVIDSGEVALAPIRDARAEMEGVLSNWLEAAIERGC